MMYDFRNKDLHLKNLNSYMLIRTLQMFDYTGLPNTIPERELERILQLDGCGYLTEHNDDLYLLRGTLGGETDEYLQPTTFNVANNALKLTKTYDLKTDSGILFINDDLGLGIEPLLSRYNTLMMENELTLLTTNYNSRIQSLISAGDDVTRESAERYLQKIVDGELGVIGENRLFEGIKVQSSQTAQSYIITHLIEYQQYLKASLYNELGIQSNYNMKRERLTSNETEMNDENLYPLVHNMLEVREEQVQRMNDKYGLDVTVELGSIWKHKELEEIQEDEVEGILDSEESNRGTTHDQQSQE